MDSMVRPENLRSYADPLCPDCFGRGYFVELATAFEPGDEYHCDCVTAAFLAGEGNVEDLPLKRIYSPLPLAA